MLSIKNKDWINYSEFMIPFILKFRNYLTQRTYEEFMFPQQYKMYTILCVFYCIDIILQIATSLFAPNNIQ